MPSETTLYQDMLEILNFFKYDFKDNEFEDAAKLISNFRNHALIGDLDPVFHHLIKKQYETVISCQKQVAIVDFYRDLLPAPH